MAGQVYSFESSPAHMLSAVHNYEQWRANWALTNHSSSPWPDNVQFFGADLSAVGEYITAELDAVSPQAVIGGAPTSGRVYPAKFLRFYFSPNLWSNPPNLFFSFSNLASSIIVRGVPVDADSKALESLGESRMC